MFETLPKLNGTAKVELIINGLSMIVEVYSAASDLVTEFLRFQNSDRPGKLIGF